MCGIFGLLHCDGSRDWMRRLDAIVERTLATYGAAATQEAEPANA